MEAFSYLFLFAYNETWAKSGKAVESARKVAEFNF